MIPLLYSFPFSLSLFTHNSDSQTDSQDQTKQEFDRQLREKYPDRFPQDQTRPPEQPNEPNQQLEQPYQPQLNGIKMMIRSGMELAGELGYKPADVKDLINEFIKKKGNEKPSRKVSGVENIAKALKDAAGVFILLFLMLVAWRFLTLHGFI